MKRKSINTSIAVLLFLLFTTISNAQSSFYSSQRIPVLLSKHFPLCTNVYDAIAIGYINTVYYVNKKVFTTIQLPKREL